MFNFSDYDLIQIFLLLLACWGCYRAGIDKGTSNVLDFLHEQGVIKYEEDEETK